MMESLASTTPLSSMDHGTQMQKVSHRKVSPMISPIASEENQARVDERLSRARRANLKSLKPTVVVTSGVELEERFSPPGAPDEMMRA